jgi:hypothetical protein
MISGKNQSQSSLVSIEFAPEKRYFNIIINRILHPRFILIEHLNPDYSTPDWPIVNIPPFLSPVAKIYSIKNTLMTVFKDHPEN